MYKDLFPLNEPNGATGGDKTEYRKISGDYVEKVSGSETLPCRDRARAFVFFFKVNSC